MTVKLKFNAGLNYQIDAVASVVDLFGDLPKSNSPLAFSLDDPSQLLISDQGVSNPVPIGTDLNIFEEALLRNTRSIQQRNGIASSPVLENRRFSIEMETGTGKTYVYLRTMFELNKVHGFAKFVVVVPSVAIREGVLSSAGLMREHFMALYSQPFDVVTYDSTQLGRVRQFASSSSIQVMVINIQAFAKDVASTDQQSGNIINRSRDQNLGRKPIEQIQATNPIVIVDEPQKMGSANAIAAIDRLNPFVTLQYSATLKTAENLVYRLGPVEAYEQRLVKRIEVAGIEADANLNSAFVQLVGFDPKALRAKLRINQDAGLTNRQTDLFVKQDDDLYEKSKHRPEYADGFIVAEIDRTPGAEKVCFSNGREVSLGESLGSFDADVRRAQIRTTVQAHLEKELAIHKRPEGDRLKVLSLVFLDRVASYRAAAASELGEVGQWFEEAYNEFRTNPTYAVLNLPEAPAAHAGYFAGDPRTGFTNSGGDTKAAISAYELIMQRKEQLLSLDEPVRFIFSHSALQEGWDNPNVFQVCMLADPKSAGTKRQQIGRGLRLPVNEAGDRVRDPSVNVLTVVANESYLSFAKTLQEEYRAEGVEFGIVTKVAFAGVKAKKPDGDRGEPLGQDVSASIWTHLCECGYLASDGAIQPKFAPLDPGFVLDVPAEFATLREEITDVIRRFDINERIGNRRARQKIAYRKQVTLDPEFAELWSRISKRTRYRVSLSTPELLAACLKAIKDQPTIQPAKIRIRRAAIEQSYKGVTGVETRSSALSTDARPRLPDILAELQNETDLTRATIVKILQECGKLGEFVINPQAFISMVAQQIQAALQSMMVDGIEYQEIAGLSWELRRLEESLEASLEPYLHRLYKVQNHAKTPFDHVELDSQVERAFAKKLDENDSVRFFLKLPSWFAVDTPIGTYNPDWAIAMDNPQGGTNLYLVRETKSTIDFTKLRNSEALKVRFATKHFESIGVDYGVVRNIDDLIDTLPTGPS